MMEPNGRLLQSFGIALFAVGVCLLGFAVLNPDAPAKLYGLFGMATFLMAFGLGWLPYAVVDVIGAFIDIGHKRVMYRHEQAERALSLSSSRVSVHAGESKDKPAQIVESGATSTKDALEWQKCVVGFLEAIVAGSAKGPYYKGGMDALTSYEVWRFVFVPIAIDLKLINPIASGQKTDWREGITAFSAMRLISETVITTPLPPYYEAIPPEKSELETQ